MNLRRTTMVALAAVAAAVLAGCGDAETADERPYTKAPLENMGVFIEPEQRTEMDRLGEPDVLGRLTPASDADEATED